MSNIPSEIFTRALADLLDETFDNVRGYYLDRNTSLFETLAGITAEEASIPVGGKCATLAAQVRHVAFYLEVFVRAATDPAFTNADWGEIWRTVGRVTAEEWSAAQAELRSNHQRALQLIRENPDWQADDRLGNALAVLAHSAYHLGEIRQALCSLRK